MRIAKKFGLFDSQVCQFPLAHYESCVIDGCNLFSVYYLSSSPSFFFFRGEGVLFRQSKERKKKQQQQQQLRGHAKLLHAYPPDYLTFTQEGGKHRSLKLTTFSEKSC